MCAASAVSSERPTQMLNPTIFLIWLTEATTWQPRNLQCVQVCIILRPRTSSLPLQSVVRTTPGADVLMYSNTLSAQNVGEGVRVVPFELDELVLGTPIAVSHAI